MNVSQNTLRQEKKCPCCGQVAEFKYSASPLDYCLSKNFDIYACNHCGHGTTENIGDNDLESVYEDGAYDPKEKPWHKLIRGVFNIMETSKVAYLNKNKQAGKALLEIGTGKGDFLQAALAAGYDAYGIEPSSRSYQIAKTKLGDKVFPCTLENIHLHSQLNKKYDFIFLWHVLEHLTNPEQTIHTLKSFLKPTGVLIFGVPNFDSYQSRFGKSNWYHLDPPRHLSHFTPRSAVFFLQKNSMTVRTIFYNSFYQNLVGDIITLSNCILPHKNIIFNLLRFNSFYFKRTQPIARILNSLAAMIITPLLLIPVLLFTLINQGMKKSGTIVVIAGMNSSESPTS